MFRLNREHGTTLVLVTHDVGARVALRAPAVAGRRPARRRRARRAGVTRRCRRCDSPGGCCRAIGARGELDVLIAAIVLAVASVGTVGFFADRVKGALTRRRTCCWARDVMIPATGRCRTHSPRGASARARRRRRCCASTAWCERDGADARRGRCCRRQGGRRRLSAARRDPARRCRRSPAGEPRNGIPPRGEAWPDARLAARLERRASATHRARRCDVHRRRDRAAGARSRERHADRSARALLINLDDVPATQSAAAGQSRDVPAAGRRRRRAVALDRYHRLGCTARVAAGPADGKRPRPAARGAADARARREVPRRSRRWSR